MACSAVMCCVVPGDSQNVVTVVTVSSLHLRSTLTEAHYKLTAKCGAFSERSLDVH